MILFKKENHVGKKISTPKEKELVMVGAAISKELFAAKIAYA